MSAGVEFELQTPSISVPPRRARRLLPSRPGLQLRLLAAAVLLAGTGLAVVAVLRGPFGFARLTVLSLAPLVVARTAALAAGRKRGRAADLAGALAMGGLVAASLGVYGVPLVAPVLAPMLALTAPAGLPLAASGLLLALCAVSAARSGRGGGLGGWAMASAVTAGPEAIYFGGFLMGSAAPLGLAAPGAIFGALLISARIRGVPLHRAALGAGVLVGSMLWSGSAVVGFAAHLALLGAPGVDEPASEEEHPNR